MKFERQLTTNRKKSLVLTSVTRLILRLTTNGMVKLHCMSERSTHTSFSRCFAYELYAKHNGAFSMYFYFISRYYTRLNTWWIVCILLRITYESLAYAYYSNGVFHNYVCVLHTSMYWKDEIHRRGETNQV